MDQLDPTLRLVDAKQHEFSFRIRLIACWNL